MTAWAPAQPTACSAALIFGTIPPLMTAVAYEAFRFVGGHGGDLLAGGVADAVHVRHEHQLAGSKPGGDAGGRVVGVTLHTMPCSSRARGPPPPPAANE